MFCPTSSHGWTQSRSPASSPCSVRRDRISSMCAGDLWSMHMTSQKPKSRRRVGTGSPPAASLLQFGIQLAGCRNSGTLQADHSSRRTSGLMSESILPSNRQQDLRPFGLHRHCAWQARTKCADAKCAMLLCCSHVRHWAQPRGWPDRLWQNASRPFWQDKQVWQRTKSFWKFGPPQLSGNTHGACQSPWKYNFQQVWELYLYSDHACDCRHIWMNLRFQVLWSFQQWSNSSSLDGHRFQEPPTCNHQSDAQSWIVPSWIF